MKLQNYILASLIILIVLVLIDISVGIWYWNRLNLIFNSTEFNNILTPLLTISAVIIYAWALNTTRNQNKIILSQSIKPFYEKEIQKYVDKAKVIKIESNLSRDENINGLNYIEHISDTLLSMTQNEDFINDYNISKSKSDFVYTKDYFEKRSYFGELKFIYIFALNINPISFLYGDLKSLIEEINNSKLIQEDKLLLKNQIHRTFLSEYMELIRQMDKNRFYPPIPLIYNSIFSNEIKFELLSQTSFREHFTYFETEF